VNNREIGQLEEMHKSTHLKLAKTFAKVGKINVKTPITEECGSKNANPETFGAAIHKIKI
jgi:hypothetical protein